MELNHHHIRIRLTDRKSLLVAFCKKVLGFVHYRKAISKKKTRRASTPPASQSQIEMSMRRDSLEEENMIPPPAYSELSPPPPQVFVGEQVMTKFIDSMHL